MSLRLSRSMRTAVLTWHILTSVGWFALAAVLVIGPYGADAPPVAVSSIALMPTVAVSIATGCALSAGSAYGLLRYWWVVAKLVATAVLVAFGLASLRGWLPHAWESGARLGAMAVLFAMVALSVAKPRARTPYGRVQGVAGRHAKP